MLFNVHRDGKVIETDLPSLFLAKLYAQERNVNGDRIEQVIDGVVVKAWDKTPAWGWVVDPKYMEVKT